MKIACSKNDLIKGITIVSKAVPSRTTMTILECILIDATNPIIKFTANDMELGIETEVTGMIQEKGKVALDAKLFSEIIRKLPDNDVTISTNENLQTTITCENSEYNIMGMDGDEFPDLPYVDQSFKIMLSQFTLKEMIRQTIISIAQTDTNKLMTGELFEIRNGILRVISLDGHRISIRNVKLDDSYEDRKVIVPGKTVTELLRILSGETEDQTEIYLTENHILFSFSDTLVISRLIEGNFFNVDRMVSMDYETKVMVNRQDFVDSLERSIPLISETDKQPVIETITDDQMSLKMKSMAGSMDEDIAIEKEGSDLKIAFNPRFLLDALRVIDDETITVYYTNSKAPCIIRDDEESYVYLVLPVNFIE